MVSCFGYCCFLGWFFDNEGEWNVFGYESLFGWWYRICFLNFGDWYEWGYCVVVDWEGGFGFCVLERGCYVFGW